jgi:hypothetical protein
MTNTNPIAAAVAPLRAASVAHAVERMTAYIEGFVAANPVGTIFSERFPRPSGFVSRRAYMEQQAARRFAFSCLSVKADDHTMKSPERVVGRNETGIARLIEETAAAAAADFDAYVAKLSAKVGECDAASVVGALWEGSTLSVTKGATVEQWKTRQIINVSCLGKLFNQWPTRLAK